MLATEEIQGNWKQLKGKLKERWGELTDNDFAAFGGDAEQLVGIIQQRTGESRAEIENYVEELLAEGSSVTGRVADAAVGAYQTARDSVASAYDRVSDSVRDGYAATERTIQEHPGKSLAVAFGVGMISGVIVGLVFGSR